MATSSPTRTRTPALPPSGPPPGHWEGPRATFNVTSDQAHVWDVRIKVPVPGCETWVYYADTARIVAGSVFSFTVDLRENGLWRGKGDFTGQTSAVGVAQFVNVYFGMSCGIWSGLVNWTATWHGSAPNPTATPTPRPSLPTLTPVAVAGIYGRVRYQGTGIPGITLVLERCPMSGECSPDASKVMTVTTRVNGLYNFIGVPALPASHNYRVLYFNDERGGNMQNDHYLWRWYGPLISSYTAGSSVPGGDFDIADISLQAPADEEVTLPTTFVWSARGITGETYSWDLFDRQTGQTVCESDSSLAHTFTLTSAFFENSCHGTYGADYGWFVWAYANANGSAGFGDSYYYAEIKFRPPFGSPPTPNPISPPDTPAPGADRPHLRGRD